jgi:hypothetical protein
LLNVANIYYNQPVLSDIAATFHVSQSRVGSLPVLTQAGMASACPGRGSPLSARRSVPDEEGAYGGDRGGWLLLHQPVPKLIPCSKSPFLVNIFAK